MDKLKFGEIAVLENGKEYICFATITDNNESYVYLVSNFKPVEICFVKQEIIDNNLVLTLVTDKNQKEHLLELFQNQYSKAN